MKKSIFLISIILNISLVSAQTMNVLGKEFSLLTVLPGILAAILVLFFIILFIKDSISNYLKRKTEVKEPEIKEVKKEETQIKEKKSEVSKGEKISEILTRFKSLNANNADPKKALSDLDSLAKDFFKEKYSIQQEYSLSELESLATVSKEEAEISKEISTLKYSGQQIKSIDIGAVNSKLYKIIRESCKKDTKVKTHLWGLKIPQISKEKIIQILKNISLPKISINKIHLPRLSLTKIYFSKPSLQKQALEKIHSPRFSLSTTLKKKIIIMEIEKGIELSKTDMHEAKKIYGKALINYYRLPIEEEEKLTRKLAELYERMEEVQPKLNKKIKRLIELKEKNKISREAKELVSHISQWVNKLEEESRKKEIRERIEKSEYPVHVEVKTRPKSIEYQIKEITTHAPVIIPKKNYESYESEEVKKLLEERKKLEREVVNTNGLIPRYKERQEIRSPIERIDNPESKEIKRFLKEEERIKKELYAPKRKELVNVENLRSRYRTLAEKESRYRPLSEKVERKIDVIASRYSSKSQI